MGSLSLLYIHNIRMQTLFWHLKITIQKIIYVYSEWYKKRVAVQNVTVQYTLALVFELAWLFVGASLLIFWWYRLGYFYICSSICWMNRMMPENEIHIDLPSHRLKRQWNHALGKNGKSNCTEYRWILVCEHDALVKLPCDMEMVQETNTAPWNSESEYRIRYVIRLRVKMWKMRKQ